MINMPRTALLCGLVALAGSFQASAQQRLSYEPAKVQLSGTMVTEPFYGPPNFGEDPAKDKKVQVLELKLDAPVDVIVIPPTGIGNDTLKSRGNDLESFYGVTRVGLVDLQFKTRNIEEFLGQHVTVTGTLHEKDNGLQYVNVLLIVDKISASVKASL